MYLGPAYGHFWVGGDPVCVVVVVVMEGGEEKIKLVLTCVALKLQALG